MNDYELRTRPKRMDWIDLATIAWCTFMALAVLGGVFAMVAL